MSKKTTTPSANVPVNAKAAKVVPVPVKGTDAPKAPVSTADPLTEKIVKVAARAFATLRGRLADAQGYALEIMADPEKPGTYQMSPLAAVICDLGLLKPGDEVFQSKLPFLAVCDPKWTEVVKVKGLKGFRPSILNLLFDLQSVHDGIPAAYWKGQMYDVADTYGVARTIVTDAYQLADRTKLPVANDAVAKRVEELAKKSVDGRRERIAKRQAEKAAEAAKAAADKAVAKVKADAKANPKALKSRKAA